MKQDYKLTGKQEFEEKLINSKSLMGDTNNTCKSENGEWKSTNWGGSISCRKTLQSRSK